MGSAQTDLQSETGSRRGWRERFEPGLYRQHSRRCPRSADHRPGGRCGDCPWVLVVPGAAPGMTRQVRHYGSITEARAERRRLLAAGRPEVRPSASHTDIVTVRDLARAYLVAHDGILAPSTLRGHSQAYVRSIDALLGDVELRHLTRRQVGQWLAAIAQTHGRHGCWKALTALRTFCRYAESISIIPENPANGMRLPKATGDDQARRGSRRVLTLEELARLIGAGGSTRIEVMIRVSAECGLRLGEVVGLRWPDIDLQAQQITVARSVWQEPGSNGSPPIRHVKRPKSGEAKTIAMGASLAARLADWYAESVIGSGAQADGYVFPGKLGGPMGAFTPGQALGRVCRRAGLVDDTGRPLVSWHSLRHTSASVMLAHGVPLPDVAAQLRHADPRITAQVYSHSLGADRLQAAASVFDALSPTRTLHNTLHAEAGRE